jgi:AbrB family looped-hinge helix DNA binding protein
MRKIALKVDTKGRIQLPKQLREELGIEGKVSATIENGRIEIEPLETILGRLSKNIRFKFKSVGTDMPKIRKAAETQLYKEI